MDALVRSAENVLRRHAAPALRLSELLGHVRADTGLRTLDQDRLRGVLETRPDRFRLLDPWRGPWRFVRRASATARGTDPWVVVVGDPGHEGGAQEGRPRPDRRLSASVRWHGIAVASGAACTALGRKAA
jgi:hypothetical protein